MGWRLIGEAGRVCGGLRRNRYLSPMRSFFQHAILLLHDLVVKTPVPLWCRLAGVVGQRNHQQHSKQQKSLHATPQ